MNTISERMHHDTIQLSAAQKFVLSKLISSDTSLNAFEAVSRGSNVVAARDMLTKLGLMTLAENDAQITENGQEALRKEGLMDEMGELTETGQLWGFAETPEDAAKAAHAQQGKPEAPEQPTAVQDPMGGNAPTDTAGVAKQDAGGPDAFSLESIQMLRGFQEVLRESDFLKKNKS